MSRLDLDLTPYETSLALALVEFLGRGEAKDCQLCRMPYPYCHCDDEDEQTSSSALAGVWERLQ